MSDCGFRWHFYNNSKLTVDMCPLDYSTCKTLILLLVAVLLVYTIVDCEVLMRETDSGVLSWLTERSKTRQLLGI